jgi:hypothetical protein
MRTAVTRRAGAACLAVALLLHDAAAADDCVYLASAVASEMAVVDLAALAVSGAVPAVGVARWGVSLGDDGRAYMPLAEPGGAVTAVVMDPARHVVVDRVPLPACAAGRVRVDATRARLFVAEACDDGIVAVDLASGNTRRAAAGCARVTDLALLGDGGLFALGAACSGLARIDPTTLAAQVVSVPGERAIAALLDDAGAGAMAIAGDGTLLRLGAAGRLEDMGRPSGLTAAAPIIDAVSGPDASSAAVLAGGGFDPGGLFRIDLEARVAEAVPLAAPVGVRDRLTRSPDGERLLVTHYASGMVEVVDARGATPIARLMLDPGITGAAAVQSASCVPPPSAPEPGLTSRPATAPMPASTPGRAAGARSAPARAATTAGAAVDESYVDCSRGEPGDGSAERPWNTLADAVRELRGGGPDGAGDGRADLVHVRNGPCVVDELGFAAHLGGPGPDCTADDEACTIFRGEPEPVSVIAAADKTDGFLIQDGVDNLKLEHFAFIGDIVTEPPNGAFDEAVKISGGGTTNIVLSDISVVSGSLVHDSGVKVLSDGPEPAHHIVISGGEVRGVAGVGYTVGGPPTAPTYDVVLRDLAAVGNGGDGFVVSRDSRGVSELVFDRTRAESNAGDGYDIYAAFDARPEQVTQFTAVTARGNGPALCAGGSQGVGIKAWHSAVIDGAVVEDNCQSGISLRRSESVDAMDVSTAFGAVTNSTVINNARVGGVQIDLSRARGRYEISNCTLASTEGKSAFSYLKRYACAEGADEGDVCSTAADCLRSPCGAGGAVTWDHATLYRDTEGRLVGFVDRAGVEHACRNGTTAELPNCDAVGDCNFDFAVTVAELVTGTRVLLGTTPLRACPQLDRDGDRAVSVAEVVSAVAVALGATRTIDSRPPG